MKSGSAITGVAEIVLSVRDLPRMRQFYEPDMNAHALFFHDPEGNQLELICHNSGE